MERSDEALRRRIKELILRACDVREVTPDDIADETPLFGAEGPLDLTSLDAVEIAMEVEQVFKVRIENMSSARECFRCVATLAEHVASRTDPQVLERVLGSAPEGG